MIKPFIIIKSEKKLTKVFLDDILYCKAEGSYTQIVSKNLVATSCKVLKLISCELEGYNFFRINRSYLINFDNCIEIKKNKRPIIVFSNKTEL
ncbi:MAG: LytTR family transcriptional regulator [Bacteroidetes bacterium]|nr:LytTR family transcriptional regulator [Bacteroidota bacterium]